MYDENFVEKFTYTTFNPGIATVDKNIGVINRAYLYPINIENTTQFKYFRVLISGGTGSLDLGIYDSDFILINSKISSVSTVGVLLAEINTVLKKGLYYLAISTPDIAIKFKAIEGGGTTIVKTKRIDAGYPLPKFASIHTTANADIIPFFALSFE